MTPVKFEKLFQLTLLGVLIFLPAIDRANAADDIVLDIRRSIQITWASEHGKSYRLMSTVDVGQTNFQTLGASMDGTGGNITVFYDTTLDQKVYFKVEESTAPAGQATAAATVNGGFLTGISVLENGFNYVDTPTVTITDSTGSGATAVAIMSNGTVTGISVTDAGSGYSGNPTIVIGAPPPIATLANRLSSLEANFNATAFYARNAIMGPAIVLSGLKFSGTQFGTFYAWDWDCRNVLFENCVFFRGEFGDVNVDITGTSFVGSTFEYANFNNVEGADSVFDNVTFTHTNGGFSGSNPRFEGANLQRASFKNVDFAIGSGAASSFDNADVSAADFSGSDLSGAVLARANCRGASFVNAVLTATSFYDADLSNASLLGATGFDSADTTGTTFNNTTMPDGSIRTD